MDPLGASAKIALCFGTAWGLAYPTRGRNVAPPALSLPGPFVGNLPGAPLAAYRVVRKVRARISGQVRTRPGRMRTAPFET